MNKLPLKKSSVIILLKKIKKINLGREKISLDVSLGRFLDENLISKIQLPPFKNSAVDGFALHKSDIFNKKNNLEIIQRIAAGDLNSDKLKKGQAARIFTGAKMPINSNTVVMQENTIFSKDKVKINKMPNYGENCRYAGEDISIGQKIISKGNLINSTNINLIAAIGKKDV